MSLIFLLLHFHLLPSKTTPQSKVYKLNYGHKFGLILARPNYGLHYWQFGSSFGTLNQKYQIREKSRKKKQSKLRTKDLKYIVCNNWVYNFNGFKKKKQKITTFKRKKKIMSRIILSSISF